MRSIGSRARVIRSATEAGEVDLATRVGSVMLPNPVMTASGTAGHGVELAAYLPFGDLGAFVVKSLSAGPWPGNAAPRVHETSAGMLNSVGLQGPGIDRWMDEDLGPLVASGARIVVSVWGRSVGDFEDVARRLADGLSCARPGPGRVVAVEVNVSCPNVEDRRRMFAHSPAATSEAVAAVGEGCPGLPRWAKLSPNVADVVEIAASAYAAGAEAVTLVNTVLAMAIDPEQRQPVFGPGRGGGLSGDAIRPIAVRAVFDVHAAFPDRSIVGVGGVSRGVHALELVMAGADAVQVGTATFRDPRSALQVLRSMERWCAQHGARSLVDLKGVAHDHV